MAALFHLLLALPFATTLRVAHTVLDVRIPLNLRAGTFTNLETSRALVWEATLCYPVVEDEVLLIEKQRGLGAGKLVGAGGKLEAGESPRECLIREVREELEVTVPNPVAVGAFTFRFGDDDPRLVHVFRTDSIEGLPSESPEAVPRWFPADALPYDRMWADDRYWLPHLLEGTSFTAHFDFDETGEELLRKEVISGDDADVDATWTA